MITIAFIMQWTLQYFVNSSITHFGCLAQASTGEKFLSPWSSFHFSSVIERRFARRKLNLLMTLREHYFHLPVHRNLKLLHFLFLHKYSKRRRMQIQVFSIMVKATTIFAIILDLDTEKSVEIKATKYKIMQIIKFQLGLLSNQLHFSRSMHIHNEIRHSLGIRRQDSRSVDDSTTSGAANEEGLDSLRSKTFRTVRRCSVTRGTHARLQPKAKWHCTCCENSWIDASQTFTGVWRDAKQLVDNRRVYDNRLRSRTR